MKFFFARLVILAIISSLYAENLKFSIPSRTGNLIEFGMEWDEKWFGKNSPTEYNHGLARMAAFLSDISYFTPKHDNENDTFISACRTLGIQENDILTNYDIDYGNAVSGKNQAAYSFACKKIKSSNGDQVLVFILIRGTPLNAEEWISNLNVSDSKNFSNNEHEGFAKASADVHSALLHYLLKKKIDPDSSFFFITGHSRGAAIANRLSAMIADDNIFNTENIYTYTFATPNVSAKDEVDDSKYKFIWNIINAEDMVPMVPPERDNWKFKKYGNTITFTNYWTSDEKTYEEDYLPRVNSFFSLMTGRKYVPFRSGSFYPSQVARGISYFHSDIQSYYEDFFSLRGFGEKILKKAFTPKKGDNEKTKKNFVRRYIEKKINSQLESHEQILQKLSDMHACETYLSWLMALEQDELYTTKPNSQLIIASNFDSSVLSPDGKVLLKIEDGILSYESVEKPITAMQFPRITVIGFPSEGDYSVIVGKSSIFYTPVKIRMEQFTERGVLSYKTKDKLLLPRDGKIYTIKAGSATSNEKELDIKTNYGLTAYEIRKKADLKAYNDFKVQKEIVFSTDSFFAMGLHAGIQPIYGSFFIGNNTFKLGKTLQLVPGLGNQHCLYRNIFLDTEFFCKFTWSFIEIDENETGYFDIIPSIRFSLSIKPRKKMHFYVSSIFDINIKDYNDKPFSNELRFEEINSVRISDRVSAVPAFHFGIRF